MNIVIMGPPGSGKGTASASIVEAFPALKHLSSGDLIRAAIANETPLGKKVEDTVEKGILIPKEDLIAIMHEVLGKAENQTDMLLDGFGKKPEEGRELLKIMKIDRVIVLDTDEQTVVDRIEKRRVCPKCKLTTNTDEYNEPECPKCKTLLVTRKDDNVETVRVRFKEYNRDTLKTIEVFEKAGLVVHVDAKQSIEDVAAACIKAVSEVANCNAKAVGGKER